MAHTRAFALVILLAPAVAAAQPDEPSEEAKHQADELVAQAVVKSEAGDHETAAQLYQSAYQIVAEPLWLSNIASEYQQLKKSQWALTYYCKYLAVDPNGSNAQNARSQARALTIEVGGSPTIKDEDVCRRSGESRPKTEVVKPPPPPPPPDEPPPPPVERPSRLPLIGLGVAGLGVIGVGVGTFYGIRAKQIDSDITGHPADQPWAEDIWAQQERGESYNRRAIGLWIGGGVAIGAGVALYLWSRQQPSHAESVVFTPIASPDLTGFAAAGRF